MSEYVTPKDGLRREIMGNEHYYHMFANGDDAKDFITNEEEHKAAFNRFAICQYRTGVSVLSMSVEDSHPHSLLWGDLETCMMFKNLYEDLSMRSIIRNRGSKDGVVLNCELLEIEDELYLLNTGTYTITQATKDGKPVMPYDYLYGTGALYFRNRNVIMPWLISADGHEMQPVRIGDLPVNEQRRLSGSRICLPPDWLVCNGFVLPANYIDINRFEAIYRTHNCFRAFLAGGKDRDKELFRRMANARGVVIEDIQARKLCEECNLRLFGKHSTRHLKTDDRILLSQDLRNRYHLSYRQLSSLVKLPEAELRKYVK